MDCEYECYRCGDFFTGKMNKYCVNNTNCDIECDCHKHKNCSLVSEYQASLYNKINILDNENKELQIQIIKLENALQQFLPNFSLD
jgi:hypothetical protein